MPGIFDRFRNSPRSSGDPKPAALPPLPDVPARGVISAFDGLDGTGVIALGDGEQLRFGRSACRDFDPVPSAKVEVLAVEPHPRGGARATEVRAAGTSAELDRALDERDALQGVKPWTASEAAARACDLGAVTLLLREPLASGRSALRELIAKVSEDGPPLVLEFGPRPYLRLGSQAVPLYVGGEPFPRAGLDLRFVGEGFDLGRSFITLAGGLPGYEAGARRAIAPPEGSGVVPWPDPWAVDGHMRTLSRAAERLSRLGAGVIVHRAGQVVFDAGSWRKRLGDLDDPDCRPFGAWIDWGLMPDRRCLTTAGLDLFGLPEVRVPLQGDDEDEYARARNAAIVASHHMVRDNRALRPGENVRFVDGMQVGGYPLEDTSDCAPEGVSVYGVVRSDEVVELRLENAALAPAALWEIASREPEGREDVISYPTYRRLFLGAANPDRSLTEVACVSFPSVDDVPEHQVFVFQRAEGGYLLVTCGLGRKRQRNGRVADDTAHVEFVLNVSAHDPKLAQALHVLGGHMHVVLPGERPWGPEHVLSFDTPVGADLSRFVLACVRRLPLGAGAPIMLLAPVPLDDSEYASLSADNVGQWIERHANEWFVRDRWLRVFD